MRHESWVIKAPYIVTLEGPLLKDHSILVKEGVIKAIAPYKELNAFECLELPHTILFPGLINCHCHLELSQLPEPLPYPGSFSNWIEELGRLKLQMNAAQTEEAIRYGIQKLLEGGTTTVADHSSVGTPLGPLLDSPLDGIAYIEVLGVEEKRANTFYKEALESCRPSAVSCQPKIQIIPTPHAPYSLLPEVFHQVVTSVPAYQGISVPLSIHISESAEEYLLFKENRGPLLEFLETKGKAPATLGETPLQYLARLKLLPKKAMAIHANYLDDEDIPILQALQISVVHCPGSHLYFGHERFPLGLLKEAGINIALGTDSLASNHSLSLFEQMRLALETHAELTPEAVLKMATLNGAMALGREKEIGSLKEGKIANIIGVPLRFPRRSVYENILLSERPTFSLLGGSIKLFRKDELCTTITRSESESGPSRP